MDVPWTIRPASRADAADVARLERECFSDPWSATAIAESLSDPSLLALVAEGAAGIEGYVISRAIADEGEILNLAVAPSSRERGLGRSLLDQVLGRLRARGLHGVFLEVRESNVAARQLYRRRGFVTVGRRANYYRRPVEDAVVLRLALDGPA